MSVPLEEDLAHLGGVLSLSREEVEEAPGPFKLVKLFLLLGLRPRRLLQQVVVRRGPGDRRRGGAVNGRLEVERLGGLRLRVEVGGRGQSELLREGRLLEVRVLAESLRVGYRGRSG